MNKDNPIQRKPLYTLSYSAQSIVNPKANSVTTMVELYRRYVCLNLAIVKVRLVFPMLGISSYSRKIALYNLSIGLRAYFEPV